MSVIHMGIDLCGGDGCMSQQCLYGSDIGSFFDKRGSKTMPEGMRRYFLFDPCKFLILIDQFLDTISTESLSVAII